MNQEKCNTCGLCKSNCPVFLATKKETKSPRAKIILLRDNVITEEFHYCLQCGACKGDCPSEIDIPKEVRNARIKLIEKKEESEENIKLMKNLREKGNIYGI